MTASGKKINPLDISLQTKLLALDKETNKYLSLIFDCLTKNTYYVIQELDNTVLFKGTNFEEAVKTYNSI